LPELKPARIHDLLLEGQGLIRRPEERATGKQGAHLHCAISTTARETYRRSQPAKEPIDLVTALFRMHTPLAEVLAVVRKNVIAIFSDARHRSLHDR
jgi:hypothetical protein